MVVVARWRLVCSKRQRSIQRRGLGQTIGFTEYIEFGVPMVVLMLLVGAIILLNFMG